MKRYAMVGMLVAAMGACGTAGAEEAMVTRIQGEAFILRGAESMPVSEGTAVRSGDMVRTSESCNVDVAVSGIAGCRVLPGSQMRVDSTEVAAMKLSIEKGNAIFNLDKLPAGSTLEVETPTAIASVRGTQFWGRVEMGDAQKPVTTFAVREGSVEVLAKSAGQSFTLAPGQALDIPLDGAAPAIRPALEAELQAMEQAASIRTSA